MKAISDVVYVLIKFLEALNPKTGAETVFMDIIKHYLQRQFAKQETAFESRSAEKLKEIDLSGIKRHRKP